MPPTGGLVVGCPAIGVLIMSSPLTLGSLLSWVMVVGTPPPILGFILAWDSQFATTIPIGESAEIRFNGCVLGVAAHVNALDLVIGCLQPNLPHVLLPLATERHVTKVPIVRYGNVRLTTLKCRDMACSVVWPKSYDRGDHDVSWVVGVDAHVKAL